MAVDLKITRNNTMIAFLTLEDLTGSMEVIVFPKTLDRVRDIIKEDALVIIKGRISIKDDELPKIICESIEPLEKVNSSKIYIRVKDLNEGKSLVSELKKMPDEYKGDTPIYIFTSNDNKNYRGPKEIWVNMESDATNYLREFIDINDLKIVE